MAKESPEVVGDPRHRPAGTLPESACAQLLDLTAQLRSNPLIGVQAQHPVATRSVYRELLLRAIPRPVALDDAGAQRAGDIAGGIGRMRINDHDLIAKTYRAQAGFDPVRLVVSDNARGQSALIRRHPEHLAVSVSVNGLEYRLMSSVLFFDPSCQRPYDTRTLRQQATG